MYICICHGISDKKIKKLVIEEGISDIRGIKKCTALGSQCGKCVRATKEIIDDTLSIQFKQAS
ncbi:(2Fe-2S)-binding protein [Vibrio genomosp. F10]|uniref:Bacterioferritin-associated ferredoxin n=1 Tax=Vibrio genomosp. F10 str. ZF-129 TaxID=1187848 RepID=A0A1E5BKL2_9VIBR|nr:(2Fe-2S)-binding protein [Vibrio genomosp. F10]OEE37732.1 bacterioferritin [Vibrio genomosp. F10 str. ZF-129]OEE88626.1 bacterioferritin [Vibrio genomosp. F10 str. 9ZD137]OEE93484.1 bacterioferritin [Vibrio genomosp. F10 str. 9ZC157]OEF05763.1 bacterioferritin [Vibrio genomosp. F10 str. 9ZB36]